MTIDFRSITYLNEGSSIQKSGYQALIKSNVLSHLKKYDPVLVGTLPLDIFVAGSDLDIICYTTNLNLFFNELKENYSLYPKFEIHQKLISNVPSIIAKFHLYEFAFEIFGQNTRIEDQHAYKHLIIEHHILEQKGKDFKNQIISLKQMGIKTEHAFAQLLGLKGNPYDSLLNYSP